MENKQYAFLTSLVILFAFTFYFLLIGNYEFLVYTVSIGILIFALWKTDKIFHYPNLAKWGFAVWLFFHFAGGGFYYHGQKWYATILWKLVGEPYNILRYDQVIHFYCYVVMTAFVFGIVSYMADKKLKRTKKGIFLIAFISMLGGIAIGAINEIIEFSTVVFLGSTGVGEYFNNALDLVFNFFGALVSVLILSWKRN